MRHGKDLLVGYGFPKRPTSLKPAMNDLEVTEKVMNTGIGERDKIMGDLNVQAQMEGIYPKRQRYSIWRYTMESL